MKDDNVTGRFTVINESFTCLNCQAEIPPATSTCRDHCPHCLWSIHVDNFPGDRASTCKGMLEPISYQKTKKGWQICYRCQKCKLEKANIFLENDMTIADSLDALLRLSGA